MTEQAALLAGKSQMDEVAEQHRLMTAWMKLATHIKRRRSLSAVLSGTYMKIVRPCIPYIHGMSQSDFN